LTAHHSGTGPFQFVKNILGDRVYLKRNPTYWQADQPQLEALEFQFVPYTAQPTALRSGTIDMMMQVGIKDIAAFADNEEIKLDLLTSTIRPGMIELAQAFQQMAKPAGIAIEVISVPPQNYWSDYASKVPFHTGNWGFRPSIDETFMVAYHSQSKGNESNWRNPLLDELIDKARGETDTNARQALYHQAQALLMTEGAVIIPYFTPVATAIRPNVQGFAHHPNGWLDFRTTWVS
jgi:ABC-type transport system substrate-binding protein